MKFYQITFEFIIILTIIKNIKSHFNSSNPLMLLVSFDGFRWDYLKTYNLTNFNYLKSVGSHSEFIYNSFSTVTFPSNYDSILK